MAEGSQLEQWSRAAGLGDSLAASKLLAAYHPLLRARVFERMGPTLRAQTEPEDLLQQVYLQVLQGLAGFTDRGPASFLNWVLTILEHRLIDARRLAGRRLAARPTAAAGGGESYWNLLDRLYSAAPTASRLIRREEAVGALLGCVATLSESYRQVIQLRFLEGRPVGEVAKEMGKTDAAVVSLSKRALEALRESMDRLGEFTRGE